MKLAIMQPYFVPYIGYWQLLNVVDRFVIYDDVTYIKGGWINRNRILINGKPSYITIPLYKASSYNRICDIAMQSSPIWRRKMIKSIEYTYQKAPFFAKVFPIIEEMICYETDNLADFLANQLRAMTKFMGLETEFVMTSRCYQNNNLTGLDRILDICKREDARIYINPQGGQELYDTETFRSASINLRFLVMDSIQYKQRAAGFTPYLSIIDALMEIGPLGVEQHLNKFDLR